MYNTPLEILLSMYITNIEKRSLWDNKYPFAIKSCEANWDVLSPFFKFPKDVRRIIRQSKINHQMKIKLGEFSINKLRKFHLL